MNSENRQSQSTPTGCDRTFVVTEPPTNQNDSCPIACQLGPLSPERRADCVKQIRNQAIHESTPGWSEWSWSRRDWSKRDRTAPDWSPERPQKPSRNLPKHPCNGDEIRFQKDETFKNRFPASFTKGLPHNQLGEVEAAAYCQLLESLASANPKDFERIPLGGTRKLANPQAAFAFDLEGADSHALFIPPAPSFSSARELVEIAENYWMALTRDVPFTEYETNPLVKAAAEDLRQYKCLDLPDDPLATIPTTPENLFRGNAPGEQVGPYISQFFYIDAPFGSQFIPAQIRTIEPGIDYLTAYEEWLTVQNGNVPSQQVCDDVRRFIRSGRDLAQYVHVDLVFNVFFNAGLTMLAGRGQELCEARPGIGIEFERCLPYVNPGATAAEPFLGSRNQTGFSTFGAPHLLSLLLEVTNRALKAVWFQKWSVHRRLRPEEFGGRIHNRLVNEVPYPFNEKNFTQLQSNLLPRVFEHNQEQNANRQMPSAEGTYLLPMAYAEGSPTHPAYGAGHATAAAACGTILKAFFAEDLLIPNPVVPTADGLELVPFQGEPLTVEGEINKLVGNIALGRNIAGVHWRTDDSASRLLGEELAISVLCDQRNLFNELYEFRFTRFDGQTSVRIRPGNELEECPIEEDASQSGDCDRRRRPNAPAC